MTRRRKRYIGRFIRNNRKWNGCRTRDSEENFASLSSLSPDVYFACAMGDQSRLCGWGSALRNSFLWNQNVFYIA